MRVLVACEFSGVVRDAFRRRGHDAVSCDLLPCEQPGPHVQGDVRPLLDEEWDLMIAHPPCTYLAASGARWFKGREKEQEAALEFVRLLLYSSIPRIAVENPVGVISSQIRRPDQIVCPTMFGDPFPKRTCLWLKGLPLLHPTMHVEGKRTVYRSGKSLPAWYDLPHKTRAKERSRTMPGFAEAMAEQWS